MSDAKQFIVGGIPVSVKDEVARESIGDLSELATTNKSNLVEAINEAAQSGGSPDAVQYTQQVLTDVQKSQARTNIGAGTYSKPSSGIPSGDLANGVIPDVSGKQDVIQDLSTIRSGAASGATAYQKPETGIPASDLASGVIPTVPTISTNISTDAASDAKTASPKAVKTYVDGVASAINDDIENINDDIEDLGISIDTIGNGAYEEAWDGDSTPVVADIPAGVVVTYSSASYTGTLAASASTVDKIYLVSDGNGNYDRYTTVEANGAYSWKKVGSTAIPLSNYATKAEVSQLEAEVHNLSGKYYGLFTSADDLPEGDANGYAFVGSSEPFAIYNFNGEEWVDSGAEVTDIEGPQGPAGVTIGDVDTPAIPDGSVTIHLSNGDDIVLNLNHSHDGYYSKVLGGAQPVGGFLPDVVYKLGTISGTVTFALAAPVTGNVNHYFWTFDTGGTSPTINWPVGISWSTGSAPALSANKHYEISILGGIAIYMEA